MCKDNRGFSIIDMLVSMVIVGLLVEAASAAYLKLSSQSKRTKTISLIDEQSKYLSDYFTFRLQNVAGGSVRPWAAAWVEDNCGARGGFPGCAGSDRLTVFDADPVTPECTIVGTNAAAQLVIETLAGVCCLTAAFGSRQAVVVNGDFNSQVFLTNLQLPACTVDVVPGQGFGGLNQPPATFPGWVGGRVVLGKVSTFFVDMTSHDLQEFQDSNNNGVADPGEQRILADSVFDLQLALGYDCNPRDGRITNTFDGNDEWLFNATGAFEALGSGGLTGALPKDLRMLAIGILVGESAPGLPSLPLSLLNGPNRLQPDWQLGKSLVRFRFRNIGIFSTSG